MEKITKHKRAKGMAEKLARENCDIAPRYGTYNFCLNVCTEKGCEIRSYIKAVDTIEGELLRLQGEMLSKKSHIRRLQAKQKALLDEIDSLGGDSNKFKA